MDFLSINWIVTIILTVSLYWLAPPNARQILLIVITLGFMVLISPLSAIILFIYATTSYLFTSSEKPKLLHCLTAIALVIGGLSYFKIMFFAAGGKVGHKIESFAIPLGMSYYAFRCSSYIIERYRNSFPHPSFLTYTSYLFFLPTLVVGPINRFGPYLEEIENLKWDANNLSGGLERILFGYFKIAFLCNYLVLSKLGAYISTAPDSSIAFANYLQIIQDGLELYLLFSGYTDIAIGFSLLLSIKVLENFNWPYFQKNISDFWRCWHISLSSWARDYVFFPVLAMTRNPYLATLSCFLVIGAWHEISLRYISWGLYHGLGLIIWRNFQLLKRHINVPWLKTPLIANVFTVVSTVLTVHFVFFGLVIVNQPDFESVLQFYRQTLFVWEN